MMVVMLEGEEYIKGYVYLPSKSSSGNSGESATNNPPKPQPISATVTSFVNRLNLPASSSFSCSSPSSGLMYAG